MLLQLRNFFKKQKEKTISLFLFFCVLCVLYSISYILQIYEKNFSISFFVYRTLGVCMLASLVWILTFLPIQVIKIVIYILVVVSSFLLYVDFFCFLNFKSLLSEAMLATVLETNGGEVISFLELYLSPGLVLLGVLFVIVVGFVCKKKCFYGSCKIKGENRIYIFFLSAIFIGFLCWLYEFFLYFGGEYSCRYRSSIAFITPLRDLCSLNNARQSSNSAKDLMQEHLKSFSGNNTSLFAKNNIENIVLILGESLSRNHMQLYGYQKTTTPLLSKISPKNLVVFNDVISPHSHTTLSLRKVLTFLNYENEQHYKKIYTNGNLISLFNLAGYSTFWISNQMDKNNGIIGAIASFAQSNDFISRFKQNFDDVFFDEALLPSLDSALNKNKHNLFVLHLMGSHASYGNRYPRAFEVFNDSLFGGKQRVISRYDNSVYYNDFVVTEIFRRFSTRDSVVLYISDHSDEIYELGDFVGHSDDRISRFMVEIPMLIYVSDIFIKKHPKLYENIRNAKNLPYMTDDLIHTILDISGIEIETFDKTRSVINKDFNPKRERRVGGNEGRNYDLELR